MWKGGKGNPEAYGTPTWNNKIRLNFKRFKYFELKE